MLNVIGDELRALAADPKSMLAASVLSLVLIVVTCALMCLLGFVAVGGLQAIGPGSDESEAVIVAGTPPVKVDKVDEPTPRDDTPHVGDPGSAEEAYRRAIDAFNQGDGEVHYAIYGESIDCFYNWTDYRLDTIRRMRDPQLAEGGFRLEIARIEPIESTADRFDFIEEGVLHRPSGYEVDYTKRVVMRRTAGRWQVTTEVDDNAHNCFPEAF